MGRIPEDIVDDVLRRASIAEVIGEYVQLKRKGNRLLGLCPFHGEKTPSFSVNEARGVFYCFGCQESGNTASFLMKHDGLSFPEAIRRLADRVGVDIPEDRSGGPRRPSRSERERYFAATTFAQAYYERELWSGRHREALDYLRSREVDEETARRFGLGFAPDAWSGLLDAARRNGISPQDLEKAGLVLTRKSGTGHYDRFRRRVMFPVTALGGRVLAFSGRTLDPEERAKYINSPETAFYTKGRELYGLQVAQRQIRTSEVAVLVEGNFDVVSLHAHGVDQACAALGTALTADQARLLQRFTNRVVLIFDGDKAGRAAAQKALRVLMSVGLHDVHVVPLDDGEDPDTAVRSGGPEAGVALLERAQPMLPLEIDRIVSPAAGRTDPAVKRQAIDALSELLGHLQDDFIWRQHVRRVAGRLELEEGRLVQYVRRPSTMRAAPEPKREVVTPLDEYERLLLWLLTADPEFLERVSRDRVYVQVRHAGFAALLQEVADEYVVYGEPTLQAAILELEPGATRTALMEGLSRGFPHEQGQFVDVFEDLLLQLRLRWARAEKQRVVEAIRQMDARGDFDERLLQEDRELNAMLRDYQRQLSMRS